ncbi:MAG: sugar kinase [Myxococcales bacterium]|nr:MAG: sugar kinase [Myxococcales bacterium]
MSRVLVVGSVAFDTLHLPSGSHEKIPGGAALYAAMAGSFFCPMRVVAVTGNDFPQTMLETMTKRDIDVSGIEKADGLTFHWEGRYAQNLNSRDTIRTDLNVFANFEPTLPSNYLDSEYVLLANIDPVLQLQVLNQVTKPKLVVADTMNFWIEGSLPALKRTLERVDVLVINEEEARQLSSCYNLLEAARIMKAMGPKIVIIKRGEYGALLFDHDNVFFAPAFPLEKELDPTGAGDTFAGAFLAFIASCGEVNTRILRQAVIYGSTVASFGVEGVGSKRLEQISRDDIDSRYEDFARLVAFPSSNGNQC